MFPTDGMIVPGQLHTKGEYYMFQYIVMHLMHSAFCIFSLLFKAATLSLEPFVGEPGIEPDCWKLMEK